MSKRATDEPDVDPASVRVDAGDADQFVYNILTTVAEHTGREVTDLDPLYQVVDPDALESVVDSFALAANEHDDAHVQFAYEGCEVIVAADAVEVRDR